MNAEETKNTRKKPVNLTLSEEVLEMAENLKTETSRSSISNVVEWLVTEKAREILPRDVSPVERMANEFERQSEERLHTPRRVANGEVAK